MKCSFCRREAPAKGFCCEKAELDTLRAVTDEVIQVLQMEARDAQTLGSRDSADTLFLASAKLSQARVRAA